MHRPACRYARACVLTVAHHRRYRVVDLQAQRALTLSSPYAFALMTAAQLRGRFFTISMSSKMPLSLAPFCRTHPAIARSPSGSGTLFDGPNTRWAFEWSENATLTSLRGSKYLTLQALPIASATIIAKSFTV